MEDKTNEFFSGLMSVGDAEKARAAAAAGVPVPKPGVALIAMYSLYDKVAMSFLQPFYFHHSGQAVRFVEDQYLRGKDNGIASHPSDFTLFHIGLFDMVSGEVKGIYPPVFVADVAQIANSLQPKGV